MSDAKVALVEVGRLSYICLVLAGLAPFGWVGTCHCNSHSHCVLTISHDSGCMVSPQRSEKGPCSRLRVWTQRLDRRCPVRFWSHRPQICTGIPMQQPSYLARAELSSLRMTKKT